MSILHPYQRRWVSDASRFKIGMFARQTGKTFSSTLEIVLDCLAAEERGARARWVILSRGERQALEAMREGVDRHVRAIGAVCEAHSTAFSPTITAHDVIFPGGSRITALPANPDTARGFSANVFLDEFAFHQDSAEIWRALFPVVSRNGLKLRVVSTPNGQGNAFHRLMTDAELGSVWSRHVVDIHEAVADGLPRDVEQLRAGLGDDDAWRQEFELEFLDEATAWLPYALISECEDGEAGEPPHYQNAPAFIGMDIAARGDLTVLWVLEALGDVYWTRERRILRRAPFGDQLAELDDLMRRYRVVRVAMDQTGMGEAVVEQAQRAYGASRVHGVLFSAAAKLDMATRLKRLMEARRVRLPADDRALRADLHSVKREAGPTGIPRLVADREHGSHADRFWALALALAAAGDGGVTDYSLARGAGQRAAHHLDDAAPTLTAAGWGTVAGASKAYGL
ncbi:terminase large subunit domain-containing protein [Marichromatium gracile]|uniref:terminase large subunit domain-containing protein n=1 Tax=Marichromatium gracile TaxID=1048 RepID=UPI000A4FA1E9|nr:terminase family protein [Marichromatium gracile]